MTSTKTEKNKFLIDKLKKDFQENGTQKSRKNEWSEYFNSSFDVQSKKNRVNIDNRFFNPEDFGTLKLPVIGNIITFDNDKDISFSNNLNINEENTPNFHLKSNKSDSKKNSNDFNNFAKSENSTEKKEEKEDKKLNIKKELNENQFRNNSHNPSQKMDNISNLSHSGKFERGELLENTSKNDESRINPFKATKENMNISNYYNYNFPDEIKNLQLEKVNFQLHFNTNPSTDRKIFEKLIGSIEDDYIKQKNSTITITDSIIETTTRKEIYSNITSKKESINEKSKNNTLND